MTEGGPLGPGGGHLGPGLIRRARRRADLSQRDLADRMGVSQSTVARWETGERSPTMLTWERIAALAGMRLVAVDGSGASVPPMREDAARDRAGRRYPAHLDLRAEGWWVPADAALSVQAIVVRRQSAQARIPQVNYDHRQWRTILRLFYGTPDDHASTEELAAVVERRLRQPARRTGAATSLAP